MSRSLYHLAKLRFCRSRQICQWGPDESEELIPKHFGGWLCK